jgi:DNA mismatch repair protein MutS
VVHRAREVLVELEENSGKALARRSVKGRRRPKEAVSQQLPLQGQKSLLIEELEKLDTDSLTPLEAITKLYELQKKAREG